MKKLIISAVVVALTVFHQVPAARAVPVGNSDTDLDYIVDDSSLHGWCFGVYLVEQDIDIQVKSVKANLLMEQEKAMVYLGINLFPWIMVYATAGESETAIDGWFFGDPAHEVEYGGGFQANLLSREIPDPTLMENKLRVNAGAQYVVASSDIIGEEWEWAEVTANLTVSIVNDLDGNRLFLPNSIALYVGPFYFDIISDDISHRGDEFGYEIGMEVFFTESVSFDFGMRRLNDSGLTAGMHVRF